MKGVGDGARARALALSPRHSGFFVLLLCLGYVAAVWWIDRGNGTFQRLAELRAPMAMAMPLVLLSYAIRYERWSWLLRRHGHRLPFGRGFCAYLTGFALTATPGKAGELLRLRYFYAMGVPVGRTLATFVFERASDLLVILLFSLFAARVFPALGMLAAVVLVFVGALFAWAAWPASARAMEALAQHLSQAWLRRPLMLALAVARELAQCLSVGSFTRSLVTGAAAWGLTSAVFVWICQALGIQLPIVLVWGIYPLAMLVGALSFVPGGVGTTELAIVLMLQRLDVSSGDAWAAAIAVRLVTLWFAVAVGALATLRMELGRPRARAR